MIKQKKAILRGNYVNILSTGYLYHDVQIPCVIESVLWETKLARSACMLQ